MYVDVEVFVVCDHISVAKKTVQIKAIYIFKEVNVVFLLHISIEQKCKVNLVWHLSFVLYS